MTLGFVWAKGECPLHGVRRKWASEYRGQALGMSPGALKMGQLQFSPGLLPTYSKKSYGIGCLLRALLQTAEICNHQSVSGKGHFVLYILIENRAGSSGQGEPWKAAASEGGLWFSFSPCQPPYDL